MVQGVLGHYPASHESAVQQGARGKSAQSLTPIGDSNFRGRTRMRQTCRVAHTGVDHRRGLAAFFFFFFPACVNRKWLFFSVQSQIRQQEEVEKKAEVAMEMSDLVVYCQPRSKEKDRFGKHVQTLTLSVVSTRPSMRSNRTAQDALVV